MRKMLSLYKKGFCPFLYLAVGVLIMSGCATPGMNTEAAEKAKAPIVESLKVTPSPEQTVIDIISTGTPTYAAYKMTDPPRVILDIRGERGSSLPQTTIVNSGNVSDITFEQSKTQAMTVKATVTLTAPFDYRVESSGTIIRLTLMAVPERRAREAMEPEGGDGMKVSASASEPRALAKADPSVNRVVGIDVKKLENGKSRVVVTTDKKVRYEMDQKGSKNLVLRIPNTSIPPVMVQQVESEQFDGVIDQITADSDPGAKSVAISMKLRELVPFHVKQKETAISIDFSPASGKTPERRIVPLQLAQAPPQEGAPDKVEPKAQQEEKAPDKPGIAAPDKGPVIVKPMELDDPLAPKVYRGARMNMDFVNADVTNILRLIGEVSNLNLVWGPEVRGTVSMRLKDIPWDQALDLVLENNGLAKRHMGNVIWIAPKAAIAQLEQIDAQKVQRYNQRLEEERKSKDQEKLREPVVTEYIPIDFAKAEEISPLVIAGIGLPTSPPHRVTLDERTGQIRELTRDARTNTIILTDLISNIQKAKDIVKQFDTPVKQVMIEARIVDATNNFTRDLGIQWKNFQVQQRTSTSIPFTTFAAPGSVSPGNPATSGSLSSPGFSSVTPNENWTPNLGMVFSNLTASGLTATVLDAKLALSEIEKTSKIISAPKVIALNGKPATISKGDQIIIPATENVAATTIDATLSLTVTPTVSYNNFVSLDVAVTDDNAPSTTRILKKAINTKMLVRSGDTVVIGGIYKQTITGDESGIPGLRQIPYFGWLFKAQRKSDDKSELLIFLTPTVLPLVGK